MSNPTTPASRYATASSAISIDRALCRIAVSSCRATIGRSATAIPCSNPSRTASTTCSSVSPRVRCCSGAYRTSAYTTPSAARSCTHSLATRLIASAVCITATVCSNVSRYRSSDPESADSTNHAPNSGALARGNGCPISPASSNTVSGLRPPSRWSCKRTLGAAFSCSGLIIQPSSQRPGPNLPRNAPGCPEMPRKGPRFSGCRRESLTAMNDKPRFESAPARSALPDWYPDLLDRISVHVATGHRRAVAAANQEMLASYRSIGQEILNRQHEEGWGSKVIDRLSTDLKTRFPGASGYSPRNLKYMRAFAAAGPSEAIVQAPLAQLPWYHHLALLTKVDDAELRL